MSETPDDLTPQQKRLARWKKLNELVERQKRGELRTSVEERESFAAAYTAARDTAERALEAIVAAVQYPDGTYDRGEAKRRYTEWLMDHVEIGAYLQAHQDIEDYIAAEERARRTTDDD
jgi:hypothetical protein